MAWPPGAAAAMGAPRGARHAMGAGHGMGAGAPAPKAILAILGAAAALRAIPRNVPPLPRPPPKPKAGAAAQGMAKLAVWAAICSGAP